MPHLNLPLATKGVVPGDVRVSYITFQRSVNSTGRNLFQPSKAVEQP